MSEVHCKDNLVYGPSLLDYKSIKGGIGEFIFNSSKKFGNKICQIHPDTNQTETYDSFINRSIKVAIELSNRGLQKGDVVVNCSPNNLDSALPVNGTLFLGGIIASLDPSQSDRECAHLIKLVSPKFIFVHENSIKLIEDALSLTDLKPEIVVCGKSENKYSNFQEFQKDSDNVSMFKPIEQDPNDPVFILFSSGTTGMPKGIVLSSKGVYYGSEIYLDSFIDGNCFMHLTTLYWISAIFTYIAQFFRGSRRILISGFENEKTLRIIETYKVSNCFLATPYAYKIPQIKDLEKFDLSSLKSVVFGGGPLNEIQLTKIKAALPHTFCTNGYGMTEISGFATYFVYKDNEYSIKHPSSCGRPVKGMTIKVVDTVTGEKLGPHKAGELHLHSNYMMNGYFNQDSASAFDEEGFVKSGDVGHFDEDCCIYVYDRIKDMFKYQSWHIVPASIESVVLEHPDVAEAVVFGIPCAEDEHEPAAAVILKQGSKATINDIKEFVDQRVLDRQKLRGGVFLFDVFPKTPTEKISRRKIQEVVLQNMPDIKTL